MAGGFSSCQCGGAYPADATFCIYCGRRVAGAPSQFGSALLQLYQTYCGKPYNSVIRGALNRYNSHGMLRAIGEELRRLPPGIAPQEEWHINPTFNGNLLDMAAGVPPTADASLLYPLEHMIRYWNSVAVIGGFWQRDAADVLDGITDHAYRFLGDGDIVFSEDNLFSIFQIITLIFSLAAYNDPNVRKTMWVNLGNFS